jgi:hypothetical protein
MGATKIVKLIYAVICLIFFVSVVNCYGANKKAEEFFEQGKKFSTVENADEAIDNYNKLLSLILRWSKLIIIGVLPMFG